MYDDPRDVTAPSPNEVLTEDSDDALADLEKEFAVKKRKLLEERTRKRERAKVTVDVERSPSPKRKTTNAFSVSQTSAKAVDLPEAKTAKHEEPSHHPHSNEKASSSFSSRFHDTKVNEPKSIDYSGRFFEFENVPPLKALSVEEHKDPVSGEMLSRRYLTEEDVNKLLQDVKVLRATKLLAKVHAPRFEEPDYVNWCFTGIVMSKSDPKTTVNNKKFMMLRVGNFLHTVDLMLFDDAFKRYWKLRKGDAIVVLNPTVKKYGQGFNLSLSDDLASVLEIGTSKNFGYCTAKASSGDRCKNVVDTLKNELCSFHEESKYKQGSRMELQGSVKPKAPMNKQGQTSQAYMARNSNQPAFVNFNHTGVLEKDVVYEGGLQFDEGKYDRPIKESHAAKVRKQKANEKLRRQLVGTAAPNRLEDLERLGIVPQAGSEQMSERHSSFHKIRQSAFQSNFLNGLGYDPTHEMFTPTERAKPTDSLEELLSISRHKKVSLKPSTLDKSRKAEKWKQNLNMIKREATSISQGKPTIANPNIKSQAHPNTKREPPIITLSDEESCANATQNDKSQERDNDSDDSDIEIAFDCAAQAKQYKTVIEGAAEKKPNSSAIANSAAVSGGKRGEPHKVR